MLLLKILFAYHFVTIENSIFIIKWWSVNEMYSFQLIFLHQCNIHKFSLAFIDTLYFLYHLVKENYLFPGTPFAKLSLYQTQGKEMDCDRLTASLKIVCLWWILSNMALSIVNWCCCCWRFSFDWGGCYKSSLLCCLWHVIFTPL